MKIGVFGDIHGNLQALEGAWRALLAAEADLVVCTGDVVQFGPEPEACIGFLREHSCDCVQGNCDRAVARGRKTTGDEFENVHWRNLAREALLWTSAMVTPSGSAWLRGLPEEARFEVGRTGVVVTHGLPGNVAGSLPATADSEVYDLMLERSGAGILVLGHTHEPVLIRRPRGWILNPGSLGGGSLPSAGTAALLDIPEKGPVSVSMMRVPFDSRAYSAKAAAAGLPDVFRRCIELGRDPRGKWHTSDTISRQRWAEGESRGI
jgi:putative phosphoesterase